MKRNFEVDMLFGKYINKYYIKYAPSLLLGLISLIAVDYLQLLVPEFYRIIVNGINKGEVLVGNDVRTFDTDLLLDKVCLPLIFIILALVIGRFLWRICIFGAGIKVETALRSRMFDHLKDLSHEYYNVNKIGNLMSLFTNDLETIQDCFGSGFMMFFDALFLGILCIIKMLRMDFYLTLFCMIPMAFLLFAAAVVRKYLQRKWEIRQQAFSNLSDFSQESFSGIAVIKAFVKEAVELLAFGKLNNENERANINYVKYSTLLSVGVTLFVESVICVILGYGGYLVHENLFDAGELVEFIGYFTSIVWPVMAISQLIEMQSRGKASLSRVSALLDEVPTVVDRPDVCDVDSIDGEIEFRNLSFAYPSSEHNVLHNISFKINKGEMVGIIGRTGSGKTTVSDLILRIYNVPDDSLFIDGKDVNTLPIRTLRRFCAYVPQDNFLFSDTISNNISLSVDSANADEIAESAAFADVHNDISSFSNGYDTVLGERGVTISGGQKQRISIARAMLKNAPILILDDAVSAVDLKTEKVILGNLKEQRAGKTTILTAHRVSTIESCSKILFLDGGRLLDCGSPEELYERCPEYRRIVDLQKLDDADERRESHHA